MDNYAASTPMSKQEMFNRALFGIRKQGGPSMSNSSCVYKNPDGRMCAGAHALPEELREGLVEELTLYKPSAHSEGIAQWVISNDAEGTLCSLQDAHDYSVIYEDEFMVNFESNMRSYATQHALKYTEVTNEVTEDILVVA